MIFHRKISWGTLQCFRKFRISKNFINKKAISLFSVETFLSHIAEKFRRGTLLCFRKFPVSKNVRDEKEGAGFTIFCQNCSVSQYRKTSCGNPSVYRKILWIRGGYHDFLSEIFCLTVPKNFAREPILVSGKFWSRNLLIKFKKCR